MTEPVEMDLPMRFAPARDTHMKTKTSRLKRQLRTVQRSLGRVRYANRRQVFIPTVIEAPLAPELVAPPVAALAPAFDPAQVVGLVAQSPVLVELQYEVLDLRHEIDQLKRELAEMRAKATETAAEVKTRQISVTDESGKVIAGITSAGVVSCQRIEFQHADG